MTKELSIESIKKELIEKLVNNMDILKYLEVENHDGIKLSQVHNTFIYDYDKPNISGNYITVDVAEFESSMVNLRDKKKYIVSVKIGLEYHTYNLDKVSAIIKEIVLKLYPYIKKYNNVPIYVKKYGYCNYEAINRLITFEIEG